MTRNPTPRAVRRRRAAQYFGAQALAGTAWWIAVSLLEGVREPTLGGWNPAALAGPDLVLFVGGSAVTALTRSVRSAAITAGWTVTVTAALCIYALATGEAGWGALLMVSATIGTLAAAATLRWGYVPMRWFFIGPFSFRPAPERSSRSNLLHSLAQLVTFWTTFFAVVPLSIAWAEQRLRVEWPALDNALVAATGVIIFVLASGVGLWSCISMAVVGAGTPLPAATGRRLVVSGPYRFVRNPMAVAGAAQTVGIGLYLGAWLVVVAAIAGAVFWNAFIRPEEEEDLAGRFGATYDLYRRRVRCWVPTFDPQPTG